MRFDNGVWQVDVYFTLTIATALLVLGGKIVGRVSFLSRYSIPDPVVGGLLAAAVLTIGYAFGLRVEFSKSVAMPLNILFFTTVGFLADIRSVLRGGRLLLLYFISIAGVLAFQNVIGGGIAWLFGIHPTNGLIAGSITLAGGHATGATWGPIFVKEYHQQSAVELAIACATYGLVAGGILGGPFTRWLINRHQLSGTGMKQVEPGVAVAEVKPEIPFKNLIESLLLIFTAMAIGAVCDRLWGGGRVPAPAFLWSLMIGIILRNALSFSGTYQVDDRAMDLLGSLALSLFLSMTIMGLKLWQLIDLAVPLIVILAVQTIVMLAYTALVTFRLLGKNYDSALLCTGQIGFGLGSTATAIAGMQSVAARYGYSPTAFLLVPVMGAFLIDVANLLVIQGFLLLPGFGPPK
jgi:glutamate:Na+ symporter, ESS family